MKNEYALVTGAGKRVGSSICKFLALQGYHVIIHYNDSKVERERGGGGRVSDMDNVGNKEDDRQEGGHHSLYSMSVTFDTSQSPKG